MHNGKPEIKQGVDILMEKLGTIETSRFLSFTQQKWIESVKRHQSGNPNSSKKEFLNNSFGSKQENCKGISKLKEDAVKGRLDQFSFYEEFENN